jgi:tRNA/tmRNA/rRNA uracil-C5-methylase (TrmA/RlmC/RlmD family)
MEIYKQNKYLYGGKQKLTISTVARELSDKPTYIKKLDKPIRKYVMTLFPKTDDMNYILVNKVGIYSMTKEKEAKDILKIISKYIDTKNATLLDATSGIGGFILNMYSHFKHVYGYELNEMQYNILQHNCNIYKINNISLVNDDYTKYIKYNQGDVVLVDPPWGGIDYKKHKTLNLMLGNLTMTDLINTIKCKLLLLKLPANHALDIFSKYRHKIFRISNYIIVLIKID